jgi:EAL domain-containing protein (putative c-di-GMP-specific phosphodiesterase class I)
LSGFEASIRWNHPERASVDEDAIFPLAEDTGLIVALSEWALKQACQDAVAWPTTAKVALRVSALMLTQAEFPHMVTLALRSTRLAAERLELEIPEQALLDHPSNTFNNLKVLKSMGVRIVMDNFGSGHSALGSLRNFPFDKVNIASSYVRRIGVEKEGDAIVRAITALCDNLGIMTGASGVDTQPQFKLLSAEECTEAQGLLFGGNLSAEQALAVCMQHTNAPFFPEHAQNTSRRR